VEILSDYGANHYSIIEHKNVLHLKTAFW